ncbi:MAG: bacteriocin [Lactobacillaceae bacterium]|jgi:bacteriocin-like protein|nr:bacteriocin [Lactobacillaceae bacterium]
MTDMKLQKFAELNDEQLSSVSGGYGYGSFIWGVVKNWRGEVRGFERGFSGKNY